MNRYLSIVCSVVFFGLFALACQASAARITDRSAAIGEGCDASGVNSTAMGHFTMARGRVSTTMGYFTVARGLASTATGYFTEASNDYSTAMGYYTSATRDHSTVIGEGYDPQHHLENSIESSFMVGYMADDGDVVPELFVRDGGVGINTTVPLTSLHVKRNISATAILENHVAAIENNSLGTSPDVLMLKMNNVDPGTAANFITFADRTKLLGSIAGNGSGGILVNTTGGDFAEYLLKADPNETLTPGDIVGLFPEGLSKKTDHAQRIMVVSTAPAVLGNQPREKEEDRYASVAFLGQVPVKVQGAFSAGDFIVPSGRGDGIGIAFSPTEIRPDQYTSIVGRSLTCGREAGIQKATVLVGLPHNALWTGILKEKDVRITKLERRLAALEARAEKSVDLGVLPGVGIFIGSLGILWMDRKRRHSLSGMKDLSKTE